METKVSDHSLETIEFTAVDAEEVAAYRSPSMLAAASLMLGLASPLVFVGPLLYVVPALGIVLGILAIRTIAASDGGLTGRGLAIIGIVLATICLFAAESNAYVTRNLLRAQARALAEQWFTYLQAGATKEALALTQPLPAEPPRPRSDGQPESTASPEERNLDAFVQRPVVQEIVKLGANAKVDFIEDFSFTLVKAGIFRVEQLYRITPSTGDGSGREMLVHMSLERYAGQSGGKPYWLVVGYQDEATHSH